MRERSIRAQEVLFVATLIARAIVMATPSVEIHVAPGHAKGDGSSRHPYGSLEEARDAVRRVLPGAKGMIHVVIHGGRYELQKPLELGAEDGGRDDVTVIWAAAEGESPEISGGVVVPWVPAGEEWRAPLPEDVPEPEWIRVGERWAEPSRYPAGDKLQTNAYLLVRRGINRNGTPVNMKRAAHYNKTLVQGGWSLIVEGDLSGLPTHEPLRMAVRKIWSLARMRAVAVDSGANEVRLEEGLVSRKHMNLLGGAGDFKVPFLGWFEAHPSFLRPPGHWAWEGATREIVYRPLPGETVSETRLLVGRAKGLLRIQGSAQRPVKHLRFKGLTFRDTAAPLPPGGVEDLQACRTHRDFILVRGDESSSNEVDLVTLPAAIFITDAHHVEFENCRFFDLGGHGLAFSSGCASVRVARCTFERIGAIPLLVGTAERVLDPVLRRYDGKAEQMLRVHTVEVERNRIAQGGAVHAGAPGIWIGFARNCRIVHNHLHDLPYTGISVGWEWTAAPTGSRNNVIESNRIERVMLFLADGGGIYCLGNQPGGRITGNLVRDIPPVVLPSVGVRKGIYLDEGSTGWTLTENVVVRVWLWSLFLHKAERKNLIERNAFGVRDGLMGRVTPPYGNNQILGLKKAGDCSDRVQFGENRPLDGHEAEHEAEAAILPKVGLGGGI